MVDIKIGAGSAVLVVAFGGTWLWHRSRVKRAAAAEALEVAVPPVGTARHVARAVTLGAIALWTLPMLLLPIHFKLGLPALVIGGVVGLGGLFFAASTAERRLAFGRVRLTRDALLIAIPGEVSRLPIDDDLLVRFWASHDLTGCDLLHRDGTLSFNYRALETGKFPGVDEERPSSEGYGLDAAAAHELFRRLAERVTVVRSEDLVPAPQTRGGDVDLSDPLGRGAW